MFFQENAGNIGLRLDWFETVAKLDATTDVIAISYRGYSGSDGTPNEKAMKYDAQKVYEFLQHYFRGKY